MSLISETEILGDLPILSDLFFAELKVKGGGDLGGSGVGMAGGGTLVSTFGKGTTPVTPVQ